MPADRSDRDSAYDQTIRTFLTLFRYLRRSSRLIHASGRTGRQLSTLRYLLDNGTTTMGALSEYLYITESSTTELVGKLEAAGLAGRRRLPSDNRVVEVALTERGRELAESTKPGGIPLLRERMKQLSDQELRELGAAFRRLNDLLELKEER